MGDAALAESGAAGAVGNQHRMFRTRYFLIVERDALHQGNRVNTLLVPKTLQVVKGQAGDCHNRSAIERRVIKTVEEMDRAGTRCPNANAELSGMFGKTRGHKRSGFFMTNADIADLVLALAQGLDHGIDAVADDAESMRGAPGDQGVHDDIGGCRFPVEARRRLA
jgi:hypothetical protein